MPDSTVTTASTNPTSITTTTTSVTPGWKTSEFWMNVIVKIMVLILAAKGIIPGTIAAVIIGVLTGIYTIARAIVKKINPNAVIPELPVG